MQITNTFEGGSNGTTITTGNSGGTSGTAFSTVTIGTAATVAFSTSQAVTGTGSLSGRFATAGTVSQAFTEWLTAALGNPTRVWGRAYFRFASVGTSRELLRWRRTGTQVARLRIDGPTNVLELRQGNNSAPSTSGGTGTVALSANTWYRVEWDIQAGTLTNTIKLYLGHSTTPLETISGNGVFATTGAVNEVAVGQFTAAASLADMFVDDLLVNDTGYPGPSQVAVVGTRAAAVEVARGGVGYKTAAVLLSTAFTGSDGAAWPSPWTNSSGTTTIQSNRGQATSPASAWSSGEARANLSAPSGRIDATVRLPAVPGVSARINVRWNPATGNGYRLIMPTDYDGFQLVKVTAYAETPLVEQFTYAWAANTDYRVAVEWSGTQIRAKRWLAAGSEPAAWELTATDSTYTTGDVALVSVNNAAGLAASVLWDDVTVADTVAAVRAAAREVARGGVGYKTAAGGRAASVEVGRGGAGLRTVAGGRASSVEVARGGVGYKTAAGGRAAQLEVGRGGVGYKTTAGTRATSVEVGRAGAGLRTVAGGRGQDVEQAAAGTPVKQAAAGRPVEVSTARAGAGVKAGAAGAAGEHDTAAAGAGLVLVAGVAAVEHDTAAAGAGVKTGAVGRPATVEAAAAGVVVKMGEQLVAATTTEEARGGSGPRTVAGGRAVEVSTARAGTAVSTIVAEAGRAVEVSTAAAGAVVKAGEQVVAATTIEEAREGAGWRTTVGGRTVEVDLARSGAGLVLVAGGRAVERDTAPGGAGLRAAAGGRGVEVDVARGGSVEPIVTYVAGRAGEVDTAPAGAGAKVCAGGRSSSRDRALAGSGVRIVAAGRAVEHDAAPGGAGVVRVAAGRAGQRDTAAVGAGYKTRPGGRAGTVEVARTRPRSAIPVRGSASTRTTGGTVRTYTTTAGVRAGAASGEVRVQ